MHPFHINTDLIDDTDTNNGLGLSIDRLFLRKLEDKLKSIIKLYYPENGYVAVESISYEFDPESDKFDSIIDISVRYGRESTNTDFHDTLSIDSDAPITEDFIAGMFYQLLATSEI